MSSGHIAFVFSMATGCWGGLVHRYSFLSAIASSFALATEDKPATADPTARGPPTHTARCFHLDDSRDEKAGREAQDLPAGRGGRNIVPTHYNIRYDYRKIITKYEDEYKSIKSL